MNNEEIIERYRKQREDMKKEIIVDICTRNINPINLADKLLEGSKKLEANVEEEIEAYDK